MAQTVKEVMTSDPRTIDADDNVVEAARAMRDANAGDVLVVEDGRPVGIVSLGDLAVARDEQSVLADISSAPPDH